MKRLGSVALVLVLGLVGCESKPSPLDKIKEAPTKPNVETPIKADHTGTIEDRVARLEDNYAKYAEALDFLGKVYAQQKAQQQAQEREEPAEDAVFAVDITPDVKAGQVEGSSNALVTIVEAWDFA